MSYKRILVITSAPDPEREKLIEEHPSYKNFESKPPIYLSALPNGLIAELKENVIESKKLIDYYLAEDLRLMSPYGHQLLRSILSSQKGEDLILPLYVIVASEIPPNEEKLFKRLMHEVNSFEPDTLIIHYGIVLKRYPLQIIDVLERIKTNYPNINIGIEKGTDNLIKELQKNDLYSTKIESIINRGLFTDNESLAELVRIFCGVV